MAFESGPIRRRGRPELVGVLPDGAGKDMAIHPDDDSYLIAVDEQSEQGGSENRSAKEVQNGSAKPGRR